MARCAFGVPLILLVASVVSAQNPPQSDPRALSLVSQSVTALSGGTSISDVTLSGTASWSNGTASETASATLMAKGTGESRFDMTLSAGPRSEIRNDASTSAQGELLASDGSINQWAYQNCLVNAAWFFPQLSVLGVAGDSTLISVYVGQETRHGAAVQHIQSYRYSSTNSATTQSLSTMDIYLDATSSLPVAFVFNIYPDAAAVQSLPVEVDFSNYQPTGGIQVPLRIQRYVAGNLGLDFSATSVQLNSGLSDSLFVIQ